MPFLEGGVKGASTRNVRPRFSAGVIPGGSSGGGPPAANLLSSLEEKKCESVRWNSAMASSSAVVGSTVFWSWSWMAASACSCSVGARPSWSSTGSSAGVFRVDGIPRNTVTCVAPGSSSIEIHGGSGMVYRMVAFVWIRVVPTPSSSSASWIKKSRGHPSR